jgi:hypothetical protein
MYTTDQLYDSLRQADAAGDTAAAQQIAEYIRSQQSEPMARAPISEPSTRGRYPGRPELARRAREEMGPQEDWTGNVPAPAPPGTGAALVDMSVGALANTPAAVAGLATEIGSRVASNFNPAIDGTANRQKVEQWTRDNIIGWEPSEATKKLFGDTGEIIMSAPAAQKTAKFIEDTPALGAALTTGRIGLETLATIAGILSLIHI